MGGTFARRLLGAVLAVLITLVTMPTRAVEEPILALVASRRCASR